MNDPFWVIAFSDGSGSGGTQGSGGQGGRDGDSGREDDEKEVKPPKK